MGVWSPTLFGDDLACDVRSEYGLLLSLLRNNHEVENKLISYYSDILFVNDEDEPVFWFALAYCEWKRGLLSNRVKEKALGFIDSGIDLQRWKNSGDKNYKKRQKVLEDLREKILSPMSESGNIPKPHVYRCPWKVGTLLAYRLTSEKVKSYGMYGKFVLLRVIKIDKCPVSSIMPTELYDENMMVGLYDWYGDEIPNEAIVEKLDFIPIKDYVTKELKIDLAPLDLLPEEDKTVLTETLVNYAKAKRVVVTCIVLDWGTKKERHNKVFSIGCDDSFEEETPEFFDIDTGKNHFTSFAAFDIRLAKCFHSRNTENGSSS